MSKMREELLRELEVENRRSNAEGMFLLQAVAERSGMNLTDLQCVTVLDSTGPITAGRLAEMMGLTTGAITGVVNRLEQKGYVRREKDPSDGRRVVIHPVMEELERVGADFIGSQEGGRDALLSDYDDRDLAVIVDLMRKSNAVTREMIARIRAGSNGDHGAEFATPLSSVTSGRLVFTNGASRLTLRAGSAMDDLYRARFEGPAPKINVVDGVVTVSYSRRSRLLDLRSHSSHVTLNAAVPWEIELRGGASRIDADLGGLELTSFVITTGFSDITVTLPEPTGLVPIRLSGGASRVTIRRPAGVQAGLTVKGGFSKLTFDQQLDKRGVKMQFQSPGYDGASNRYEIELSGGASEITIQQAN
ncbi:MAG: MarR family winged helix-turn-helix transcriptional regulator [Thermomicrobiales bacterium]